ncbi:16824_t:CDS:10 [Dentiscutata erythropus]|uniref:DNA polymerase alpha subunit B n=1 Tax=Dentiscutata erythropus TaxID=1348616 RepID=A0A9N9G4I5_9GLOM|nr:16824_t:CDS:10 [Dentiscutata erythropus]
MSQTILNEGKIEETLNSQLARFDNFNNFDNKTAKEFKITVLPDQQIETYRYMDQSCFKKNSVMLERFETLAERLKEECEIDEISDPTSLTQNEIITVGRIWCDSEGKLNSESVLLETLPDFGGNWIKLSLEKLSTFSLFPGQNVFEAEFIVNKIFEMPLLPMYRTPTSEIIDHNKNLNGKPLSVVIATGPYTLETGFEYEPLRELIKKMAQEKPDILILMGPFVDEDHPMIQTGEVSNTPGELFRKFITLPLAAFIKSTPKTKIIMIPSTKDICHEYLSFPQPPLDKAGLPKEVTCLCNPVQFRVNEILFAVSNVDLLFHLSRDETERVPGRADRMSRIVHHILTQRHLYPLFPTAIGEVNMDLKHSSSLELKNTPDVLILPSKLKYFAKIVDQVVCINPGYLCKSHAGGTYAKMTIYPLLQNLAQGADTENFVYQRTRVDIIKI